MAQQNNLLPEVFVELTTNMSSQSASHGYQANRTLQKVHAPKVYGNLYKQSSTIFENEPADSCVSPLCSY